MNLIPWKREKRDGALSFSEWLNYANHMYPLGGLQPTIKGSVEDIAGDFHGLATGGYMGNGVVFACMDVREKLFSEARFKYRQLRGGRPGDLFGHPGLSILETPWPNGTTGDLLTRMEQDASLGGNFYARVTRDGLQRMRPDWVNILLVSKMLPADASLALDAKVLGYAYYPGGPRRPGVEPVILDVNEVVHYAPKQDPLARFRGMSWLTPVIREIMGDTGYTEHKLKFLEQGATSNLLLVMDPAVNVENAKLFEERFREKYEGRWNAYKTLFVGGGVTPVPVGANFQQMDFKATQGAGETRIAAAAGVPPVIVGLSEGLQAATYSNYAQARRRFADQTMRPLWRAAAAALAVAVPTKKGAELWYDDRDIPALQEDMKDRADIMAVQATAVKTFVDAGFTPDSAQAAVAADDLGLLKHSGLVSVQLQPPGTNAPQNGNGALPALP